MSAGDLRDDRLHLFRARIFDPAEKRQCHVDAFRFDPPGIGGQRAKSFDFLFHQGAYRLAQIDRDEQSHGRTPVVAACFSATLSYHATPWPAMKPGWSRESDGTTSVGS